jgi:hypothetical protein
MMCNKICHDYKLQFTAPERIYKVYYDIETTDSIKQGVPEHTSQSAFITCIGMVLTLNGEVVEKKILINNMLEYKIETLDSDITPIFGSEKDICQIFFRSLQELGTTNNSIVLAISHNGSTNPRGEPYDLPWIISRSMYRLDVQKK